MTKYELEKEKFNSILLELNLENLWYLYRCFCERSHCSDQANSINAPDFLGWLESMQIENTKDFCGDGGDL